MTGKARNVVNIDAIKALTTEPRLTTLIGKPGKWELVEVQHVMAYTMRNCGATFREIGEALGLSRQRAEQLTKEIETIVKGGESK